MSQFVRTRIRCAIYPAKVGTNFTVVVTGATPQFYKGTGIEFEFALFDGDDLFDVSNISALSVTIKPADSPASASEMHKTIAVINSALTLEQWQNGSDQHAVVVFSATESAITAGDHDITVHGVTADDAIDADVFGTSKIKVVDAGITNVTIAPLSGSPAVDLDQLNAILGNYLQEVLKPGQTITFVTKDNLTKRIMGVANDHTRLDSIEDNT